MRRASVWDARNDHVAIADRLDLFDAVFDRQFIEEAKHFVEHVNDLLGTDLLTHCGKSNDVTEQHSDLAVRLGNAVLAVLEPICDGSGEHIEQELLAAMPFFLQRRGLFLQCFLSRLHFCHAMFHRLCHRVERSGKCRKFIGPVDVRSRGPLTCCNAICDASKRLDRSKKPSANEKY